MKVVIFAGGAKADSFKKIRGNSYGMWIATEINLHHDATIKEAFNRQLAAQRIKVFWDLNPDNPNAAIYKDYIDKYAKLQAEGTSLGGYNYEHFTIYDNITISPETMQITVNRYDPETIWYRRDILGERCVAEGLVYQQFANNPDNWIISFANEKQKNIFCADIDFVSIGIDFGGNRSLTTFVATAVHRGFSKITTLKDYSIPGKKGDIDADVLNREFIGFVQLITADYPGLYIKYGFADNEAQYLINGLKKGVFNCRSYHSGRRLS